MFFRICDYSDDKADEKILLAKKVAYSKILRYPMSTQAIQLDNYFKDKYNKSLKQICKELIIYHTIIKTGADEKTLIATFKDLKSDKLASLITFGNSEVPGCNILRFAFSQNYLNQKGY